MGCEAPDSLAVVEPEVPAAPPAPVHTPRFTNAKSGQINIKPPADVFATIAAEAKARDVPVSTVAREIFMRAYDAPAASPLPKPRIPAAVMSALRNDGRPFDQFIADLLALGLEQYLAFRSAE